MTEAVWPDSVEGVETPPPDLRTTLRLDRRFNGPPDSGNGGITCGLLAALFDADVVEVTLRRPPPLDVELSVVAGALLDGDTLVAEAVAGTVTLEPAAYVGTDVAARAEAAFEGHQAHPFPTCFVCGPQHPTGMHLFPGRVADDLVATTWTPDSDSDVMVWAALDCPGGWSADLPGRPMVLGRMACRIDRAPVPGQRHVVQGWLRGGEGRKVFTGSALYDSDGEVLAVAEATWIALA